MQLLEHALPRLGMYGGEWFAENTLRHLAFIDEREAELQAEFEQLKDRRVFTATGVAGGFAHVTGVSDAYSGEVASVFAARVYPSAKDFIRLGISATSRQNSKSLQNAGLHASANYSRIWRTILVKRLKSILSLGIWLRLRGHERTLGVFRFLE